jgi:hypothetical protein
MLVLNDICEKCNHMCNSIHFQRNFKNWTSGNNNIDKFIQTTQISDHNYFGCQALEWIPYDSFYDIRNIAKGEYRANWNDGYISYWHQNWKRNKPNMSVILKILYNPVDITLEFINKV